MVRVLLAAKALVNTQDKVCGLHFSIVALSVTGSLLLFVGNGSLWPLNFATVNASTMIDK